jgi:hypothetical protein
VGIETHVVISGTDPQNPRKTADIVMRMEQLHRDIAAMHKEAGRLKAYSSTIRDVLMDQGVAEGPACDLTEAITSRIHDMRNGLREAHEGAARALDAIDESRVDKRALFVWRLGTPGQRGGVIHR